MISTPICDFIDRYAAREPVRMHMPGHKGRALTGCEWADITEIGGADSLYAPGGIIRESEKNAARLFGAGQTLYSTEGSSQCIRAMCYLAVLAFAEKAPGVRPAILAGRNAHKAFLTAAALLDFDVVWLYPENSAYSLCRCDLSPGALSAALERTPNGAAVYVTSPDYLGNCADIGALALAAHEKGVPLLVDNAHGAYQAFLPENRHPMALGADLCCDSAHKTLPVLTGGAYLHIGRGAGPVFYSGAREGMALFGSTSPSYLILRSLDQANRDLAGDYPERLGALAEALEGMKGRLRARGWGFAGDEPLKVTLETKAFGYTGPEAAACLEKAGVVCEYADPDYLVLMPAAESSGEDLRRAEGALAALQRRPALGLGPPGLCVPERVMPIREAILSPRAVLPAEQAVGRVCGGLPAACPPAVSPVVPGERIGRETAGICRYYGIESITVVK